VDLHEDLGVQFVGQFADGLADQRLAALQATSVYFSSLRR
jgi:hypothetical protein